MGVTYKTDPQGKGKGIAVYVDGRLAGSIKKVPGGWQYWPKGWVSGGDVFPLLSECKKSLGD